MHPAARRRLMAQTHYGVIAFGGDPANEHPDPELRGHGPTLTLVACGSEALCWDALARWTAKHPLRMWESAEVVARHPSVVRIGTTDAI